MIPDFLNPRILFKIYNGKWYGKGIRIIKDLEGKITYEKIKNITEIKKVDEFTYSILIKNKKLSENINLLAFINKESNFLESVNPNKDISNGINQFYFYEFNLIHSSSINTKRGLETTTIKLIPYNKSCLDKLSSSSNSSSSLSSIHSSTYSFTFSNLTTSKKKYNKKHSHKKHSHKKKHCKKKHCKK